MLAKAVEVGDGWMWVVVAKAVEVDGCCQGGGDGWWLLRWRRWVVVAKVAELGGGLDVGDCCQGRGDG